MTGARIVAVASLLTVVGLGAGLAEAKCPAGLKKRTPDQVVADQRAALAARDWAAVACNYAPTAFMVNDQGVVVGPEEIVAWFASLYDVFDVERVVTEEMFFRDLVRELYRLDGGWFVIEDGVDTYRIRQGKIQSQSNHGLITFTGPPPEAD